jgi:CDP-paratose 2-epimerase
VERLSPAGLSLGNFSTKQMKLLITGICGFVGSTLARGLLECCERLQIVGLDNLSRPGSELNRAALRHRDIIVQHADIRTPSDLETLSTVDWVIDAAANPSVLAGVSGVTSSRQLVEHNLMGTLNLLEYCKRSSAGFIMLSTSRVYSLSSLVQLKLNVRNQAFEPYLNGRPETGLTIKGVTESFSTTPPLSLYGSSKLASEIMALEYGKAFQIPVHVNRCGVLAGAGQFGKPDQGIFSYWIHSYCHRKPLKYIGFGGSGYQVRDCLHPKDLVPLLQKQMEAPLEKAGRPINVGGGMINSISLAQLSEWCAERFGRYSIERVPQERQFDVPWLVLDATMSQEVWGWSPKTTLEEILNEIANHAVENPSWLDWSREP